MRPNEFLESLKERGFYIAVQRFSGYISSSKKDHFAFTQFVCTSFDLDIEDRTRLLALYLILQNPSALEHYKSDFEQLFSIRYFSSPDLLEKIKDEMQNSMEVDSEYRASSRTADLSIFRQDYNFLTEFKEQEDLLRTENFFLHLDELMKDLYQSSQTLFELEINHHLLQPDSKKLLSSEIVKYRERFQEILGFCSQSITDSDLRKNFLNYWNYKPQNLVNKFGRLFDDGNYCENSCKQRLLQNIISLFYKEFLSLYPSKIPSQEPSGYDFIDEIKKLIEGVATLEWISELESESPQLGSTPEIALTTSNLGIATDASVPLIDFSRTTNFTFNCAETSWRYTDDQTQLIALTLNAFNKGWLGAFSRSYRKLSFDSKNIVYSSISKTIEAEMLVKDTQIAMVSIILLDSEIVKSPSFVISDKFIENLLNNLDLESDINANLMAKICRAICSIDNNQTQRIKDFFDTCYKNLCEQIKISDATVCREDYEKQKQRLLTIVMPKVFGISYILSGLSILDFINFTSLNILDYYSADNFKHYDRDKLEEIIMNLIIKFSERPLEHIRSNISKFEHNLETLLIGISLTDIISIVNSVVDKLNTQYEKYCAYLLFLFTLNPKLETSLENALAKFLTSSYQSILARKTTFSVLASISRLNSSNFIDFSQLTYETNPLINPILRQIPRTRLEYYLRSTSILCNKAIPNQSEQATLSFQLSEISKFFHLILPEDKVQWLDNLTIPNKEQDRQALAGCLDSILLLAQNHSLGFVQNYSLGFPHKMIITLAVLGSTSNEIRKVVLEAIKPHETTDSFQDLCTSALFSLKNNNFDFKFKDKSEQTKALEFLKGIIRPDESSLPPTKRTKHLEGDENPPRAKRMLFSGL